MNGNSKYFPKNNNLNVNRLNSPIRRHRMAEGIKSWTNYMLSTRKSLFF